MYAICLAWPDEKVKIESLGAAAIGDTGVMDVSMLGIADELKWIQDADELTVYFHDKKPCKYAYVVKIQLSGE